MSETELVRECTPIVHAELTAELGRKPTLRELADVVTGEGSSYWPVRHACVRLGLTLSDGRALRFQAKEAA